MSPSRSRLSPCAVVASKATIHVAPSTILPPSGEETQYGLQRLFGCSCRKVDPRQMGGYPEYRAWKPYKDSDFDGMPDEWETAHSLNPHDPTDANGDMNGDGYTNIEKYINSIDPHGNTDWHDLSNNHDTLAKQGGLHY